MAPCIAAQGNLGADGAQRSDRAGFRRYRFGQRHRRQPWCERSCGRRGRCCRYGWRRGHAHGRAQRGCEQLGIRPGRRWRPGRQRRCRQPGAGGWRCRQRRRRRRRNGCGHRGTVSLRGQCMGQCSGWAGRKCRHPGRRWRRRGRRGGCGSRPWRRGPRCHVGHRDGWQRRLRLFDGHRRRRWRRCRSGRLIRPRGCRRWLGSSRRRMGRPGHCLAQRLWRQWRQRFIWRQRWQRRRSDPGQRGQRQHQRCLEPFAIGLRRYSGRVRQRQCRSRRYRFVVADAIGRRSKQPDPEHHGAGRRRVHQLQWLGQRRRSRDGRHQQQRGRRAQSERDGHRRQWRRRRRLSLVVGWFLLRGWQWQRRGGRHRQCDGAGRLGGQQRCQRAGEQHRR